MKRLLYVLIMCILLTSCSSTKFDSLVDQAREHYYSGEYEDAVEVYTKALDIREDAEIRSLLTNSKKEITLRDQHEEFKRKLREHSKNLHNITIYSKLEDACSDILDDVNFYVSIDANSNLREGKKIKELQGELFLESLLVDASSPYLYKILDGNVYDYAQRLIGHIDKVLSKAK